MPDQLTKTRPAAAPSGDGRIVVEGLTKRFGSVLAVDSLTFTVEPGRITGFLGPNGAGKTTTLRMVLGLVSPTAGTSSIGGVPYAALPAPQRLVGAALEASSFHPGRTARNHLKVLARTAGVGDARVDEVLDVVGLTPAARRKAGGYSLGMRQRLGLAAALIGDPQILVLDEPANGLDPEGIRWLRGFLKHLASQGRTILVSSHVLSEVQQTVDDVVIITRGRLVRQGTLAELAASAAEGVLVRGTDPAVVAAALRPGGWQVTPDPGKAGRLRVVGAQTDEVGSLLFAAGVEVRELTQETSGLETIFFELTGDPADDARPAQNPAGVR